MAVATDPFLEQHCNDLVGCVGPGTCAAGVGCLPRSCQPALHCRGDIRADSLTCEVNNTIDGRTCQTVVGLDLRSNDGDNAWIGVTASNGSVDAFNLPNTWISPSVDAHVDLVEAEVGTFSLGLYRSDITETDSDHAWSETGVFVRKEGGAGGGQHVVLGVWTLDLVPEDCFVRFSHSTLGIECREIEELLTS